MVVVTKSVSSDKDITAQVVCDSASELSLLPTTTESGKGKYSYMKPLTMGTVCICGNDMGGITYHMLFTGGWQNM